MVSNIDRIFEEISKQAEKEPVNFAAKTLIELAMEIVNQEDLHQTRQSNIKQIVENLIDQAANSGSDDQ